jgi:hypothetical protein
MPEPLEVSALFRNGDRVRAHGSEVVHLRSGRKVPIIGAAIPVLARTVLKGIREVAGEKIDLATAAEPPVAACFTNVPVSDVASRLAGLEDLPTA